MRDPIDDTAPAAQRADLDIRLFHPEPLKTEVRVGRATRLVAGVLGAAFWGASAAELLSLLGRLMRLTPMGLGDAASSVLIVVVQLLLGAMLFKTALRGRDALQEREEERTRERRQLASD